MKFVLFLLCTLAFHFSALAESNWDDVDGQGCYTEGAIEEDGTYCVYFGAGDEGAVCRRVLPQNEQVDQFLKAHLETGESVCLWGQSRPSLNGEAGDYLIYRAEIEK